MLLKVKSSRAFLIKLLKNICIVYIPDFEFPMQQTNFLAFYPLNSLMILSPDVLQGRLQKHVLLFEGLRAKQKFFVTGDALVVL